MKRSVSFVLHSTVLLLTGCASLEASIVPSSTSTHITTLSPLEFPALFNLDSKLVDLEDYAYPWTRYTTPGGRLSFLVPRSWEVDINDFAVSRTVRVGSAENAAYPIDLLFTVHPVEEGTTVADAMLELYARILSDEFTERITKRESTFLMEKDAPHNMLFIYRETVNNGLAFLHLLIPREKSILEVEYPGLHIATDFPVRILLESIRYRD